MRGRAGEETILAANVRRGERRSSEARVHASTVRACSHTRVHADSGAELFPSRSCLPKLQHQVVLTTTLHRGCRRKKEAPNEVRGQALSGSEAGPGPGSACAASATMAGRLGDSSHRASWAAWRCRPRRAALARHTPRPKRGGGVAKVSRKVSARSQRRPVHHHGRRTPFIAALHELQLQHRVGETNEQRTRTARTKGSRCATRPPATQPHPCTRGDGAGPFEGAGSVGRSSGSDRRCRPPDALLAEGAASCGPARCARVRVQRPPRLPQRALCARIELAVHHRKLRSAVWKPVADACAGDRRAQVARSYMPSLGLPRRVRRMLGVTRRGI